MDGVGRLDPEIRAVRQERDGTVRIVLVHRSIEGAVLQDLEVGVEKQDRARDALQGLRVVESVVPAPVVECIPEMRVVEVYRADEETEDVGEKAELDRLTRVCGAVPGRP